MLRKQLTVFIGRFSPFHLGHEEVLLRALESSEVVLLVIGSAKKSRSIKTPFTAEERKGFITEWYKTKMRLSNKELGTLDIALVEDYPYSDSEWISRVQAEVLNTRQYYEIPEEWPNVLTGAERDASTWYLKAFGSFFQLDLISESKVGFDYGATQLRDNYFQGSNAWEYKTPQEVISFLDHFKKQPEFQELRDEYDFVKKYKQSWAAAPYAPIFVTVDTVVIQSGHVLVVKRAAYPGKGLLALPGGFVEQNERLQDAAIRELLEETRIELSPAQLHGSIVCSKVFDAPDRSSRGRTITHAFGLRLKDTVALPRVKPQKGEATKAFWLPIAEAEANPEEWFEDHNDIRRTLIGMMK